MKKSKAMLRAEQFLALAAYNPEGEEARTAAMLLVRHIVRNGLMIVDDLYQHRPMAFRYVYCNPESMPEPKPKRERKPKPPPVPTPAAAPPDPPPRPPPEEPEPEEPKDQLREQEGLQDGRPYVIMVAKFKGKCMQCKGPIKENDHIAWYPGSGATHDKCAAEHNWPVREKRDVDG